MSKPVVLLVDDERMMLNMLGGLLQQDYRVLVATNGEQALMRAEGHEHPDLILLDVLMPGMNGYEVCQRLKEQDSTRDIPVMFLTVNQDEKEETRGFEAGAVDYINKPVRPSVLLARVQTHLQLKFMREELRQKNEKLQQTAQLRDEVERIMRHDLKTPLNSMISLPALLVKHYDFTAEHRELLRNAERSGRKMLEMINRSLDLYKMEVGAYKPMLQPLDLIPVIKAAANEAVIAHLAAEKSWCLLHCGEPAPENLEVWAEGEEMLCYPMFSNLLQNAFEASPSGGKVEINVDDQDPTRAIIVITNTGAVPEEIRERFFEKYITAGKQHGTGLGTYSARLCAETQNGSIRLELPKQDQTQIVVELRRRPPITKEELDAVLAKL